MSAQCIGGIEAVEYIESLPVPQGKEEIHEKALNRIRYEALKGIGVKVRVNKAVKPWHKDTQVCGKCGCGLGEAWFEYCPSCGTAILKNPYTEKKLGEKKKEDPAFDIYKAETV